MVRPSLRSLSIALLLTALGASLEAEDALWPGASYDPTIPTFEQVLGHAPGEWIPSHSEVIEYLEALAAAAPDRMRLARYGTTWEGRDLVWAVIGTPERIAGLDSIREQILQVADPEVSSVDASRLIDGLPATVWLAYAVHGNEISSVDAAMFTAYHLLAAQNDPVVEKIFRDALVFLDPLQNPDGRDRFVNNFRASAGIEPDPSRVAAVRDEPWPGGRTNHYLFDLNRDWFIVSQPETLGRVELLRQWMPLVFIDLHEMGADSTYYFAPEAVPYNPHLAAAQRSSLELIGRNNAKWFDRYGFDYFTREVYDAFYPGYGASWPSYYGAVSATYEMASARGLLVRRSDGSLLSFRDGVRRHFVTSISTAEMAADNREKLWRDFRDYRESAIEEGRSEDTKTIVLPAGGDVSLVDELAGLLVLQGAELQRATQPFRACEREFPTGSYVASLAQPAKRFLRVLLDPDVPMEPGFLEEQERRRAKGLSDQIYDVTAWSLPLMFNVEAVRCGTLLSEIEGRFEPAGAERIRPGGLDRADAQVGYLVPWGEVASARLLAGALRQGLVALSPERAFTLDARRYPAGTLVFKNDDNPPDLPARLAALARESGAEVVAVDTSWVEDGVNFGSRQSVRLQQPRIALAWDEPTSSYSAGAARYFLERRLGYPVSVIRTESLQYAELSRYQVVLLPDSWGSYGSEVGERWQETLDRWIREGGTLIAVGDAVDLVAEGGMGLLSTERENRAVTRGDPEAGESSDSPPGTVLQREEDYLAAIEPEDARPDAVAGVLARATPDTDHWLSAGLPEELHVLVRGRSIYQPLTLSEGVNAVRFASPDDLVASGYLWKENREQLAFKPVVMIREHGRGQVIALPFDPFPRAYQRGLDLLMTNAIFRGPAYASPRW